jgi:hypothetical protein
MVSQFKGAGHVDPGHFNDSTESGEPRADWRPLGLPGSPSRNTYADGPQLL